MTIGSCIFTPGFYYTWTLYDAWRTTDPDLRQDILDVIFIYFY